VCRYKSIFPLINHTTTANTTLWSVGSDCVINKQEYTLNQQWSVTIYTAQSMYNIKYTYHFIAWLWSTVWNVQHLLCTNAGQITWEGIITFSCHEGLSYKMSKLQYDKSEYFLCIMRTQGIEIKKHWNTNINIVQTIIMTAYGGILQKIW
jgi:hypothetical protein